MLTFRQFVPFQTPRSNVPFCMVAIVVGLLLASFISNCSGTSPSVQPTKPAALISEPLTIAAQPAEVWLQQGNTALLNEKWELAAEAFNRVLALSPNQPMAQSGMLIITAAGTKHLDSPQQLKAQDDVLDALGDFSTRSAALKFEAEVRAIRVYRVMQSPAGWVKKALHHYQRALEIKSAVNVSAAHFFMARTYRDAHLFPEAELLYRKVVAHLSDESSIHALAKHELTAVQNIQRARPRALFSNQLALKPAITRAEAAVLIYREMQLQQLHHQATRLKRSRTAQVNQTQSIALLLPKQTNIAYKAIDIEKHPYRLDLEQVLAMGIEPLRTNQQKHFNPAQPITRAAFSILMQSALIYVTEQHSSKTRFIGQPSPFADVSSDMIYFNAIMLATHRNWIRPTSVAEATFTPFAPVSGADALLAVRLVKEEIDSYLLSSP